MTFARPEGTTEVRVQVCRDPLCRLVEEELTAEGTSVRPSRNLEPRWHFWRLRGRDASGAERLSVTWQFRVLHGERTADTSHFGGADFNGDGYSDALFTASRQVLILWGAPTGPLPTLWEATFRETGATERSVNLAGVGDPVVGDFNGDGLSDFVVVEYADILERGLRLPQRLFVFHGRPEGPSTAPDSIVQPPGGDGFHVAFTIPQRDFDRDGYADVSHSYSDLAPDRRAGLYLTRRLLRGSPGGLVFQPQEAFPEREPFALRDAADVDGDGIQDSVGGEVSDEVYSQVAWVAEGQQSRRRRIAIRSDRPFRGPSDTTFQPGSPVTLCDLDGEGGLDYVAIHGRAVRVARFDVDVPRNSTQETDFNVLDIACVVDLRVTGASDLLLIGQNEGETFYWIASPSASSLRFQPIELPVQVSSVRTTVLGGHGDSDGDGLTDVVLMRVSQVSTGLEMRLDVDVLRGEMGSGRLRSSWHEVFVRGPATIVPFGVF
ncbi:MAG: VCBS repeat-containing protein [Deltaproteobacteria bacterium]|nr:VCBS repeat-containing protein [Deltaproteobacteria bacterium]